MTNHKVPTLFEWMGGAEALNTLMVKFYQRVPGDELLGPLFAGMAADHPHRVADFVGEVTGGPEAYTKNRGGHAAMLTATLAAISRKRSAAAGSLCYSTALTRSAFPRTRNSARRSWLISNGDRGWRS